jgi:5-methylcytosine-specific restriction endonuclease McrA
VEALVADDRKTAAREIEPIKFKPSEPAPRRKQLTKTEQARVFWRDSFVCRYCETRTLSPQVLYLIHIAFPTEFPMGGTRDSDHPAIWTILASCDHIQPGTRGGDWKDPDNLATACWTCQSRKGDHLLSELDWDLHPPANVEWDGLVRNYRPLWEALGRQGRQRDPEYHQTWLAAYEQNDPSVPGLSD